MRLVLDEEIEAVERDIALVKRGRHEALRVTEEDAEREQEAKKRITKARRVAVEHEIDIRFGAMVDAEWQKFRVCNHVAPMISLTLYSDYSPHRGIPFYSGLFVEYRLIL